MTSTIVPFQDAAGWERTLYAFLAEKERRSGSQARLHRRLQPPRLVRLLRRAGPRPHEPAPNGPRNRAIDMSDVIAVLFYSGAQAGGPANGNGVAYDSVKGSCDWNGDTTADKEGLCYDRNPGPAPNPPFDAGPPNGAIDLTDVLVVLAQVGLSCSGPP